MSKRPSRAAIYARVSTDTQTVENWMRALEQIAERRGWEVAESTRMPGSAEPRVALGVLVLIAYGRTPVGGISM
jgi:DNA invertase Pin-like site-specific DNA recombinase